MGLVSAGVILVLWRERVVRARKLAAGIARGREMKRRLANPDFEALEERLGHPLPASFRHLYGDRELVARGNVVVDHPNPVESDESCFVAWFNPADTRSLDDAWPGCEGLFPIADNGCNDQYLVDLSQEDPDVLYHLHETGERGPTVDCPDSSPRFVERSRCHDTRRPASAGVPRSIAGGSPILEKAIARGGGPEETGHSVLRQHLRD